MGRPPCCDKDVGIKKGPWTSEEDVILAAYVQQHGPGNWRSVPTNTGLLRCSKSCRLRWTNYLRPGIKRGNFTSHEERMIVHLQSSLGNKWASIASYLPQRTDNDIKNYWNTHLKKKIKKFDKSSALALDPSLIGALNAGSTTTCQLLHRKYADHINKSSLDTSSLLSLKHQSSAIYTLSAENVSRLLEDWMKSSPKITTSTRGKARVQEKHQQQNCKITTNTNSNNIVVAKPSILQCNYQAAYNIKGDQEESSYNNLISSVELESLLSFESIQSIDWDTRDQTTPSNERLHLVSEEQRLERQLPPFSFLEKWLLMDEASTGHAEEAMILS